MDRDAATTLSVNDLLKSVYRTISVSEKNSFSLTAAVVNHEIASALNRTASTTLSTTETEIFGSELVSFAILETPFQALTSSLPHDICYGHIVFSQLLFHA